MKWLQEMLLTSRKNLEETRSVYKEMFDNLKYESNYFTWILEILDTPPPLEKKTF